MKAKLIKSFVTVALLGLAICAAVLPTTTATCRIPGREMVRSAPMSSALALWVSAPIIRRGCPDNARRCHRGDLLFEIEPGRLPAPDGRGLQPAAESRIEPDVARAKPPSGNRRYPQVHVNALQSLHSAQDSLQAAQAPLAYGKANLELAKLNLSYTKVVAPVEGYVTNMNTSPGTHVTAGNQLMALVNTSS